VSMMVIQPVDFWFSCGGFCFRTVKLNALVVNAAKGNTSSAAFVPALPSGVDVVYAVEHARGRPERAITRVPEALRYAILPAYRRHFIDVQGSYESYLAKFSTKTRQTLRRKLRRMVEEHAFWRVFRHGEEMPEFHRLACQVAKTTYQQKLYYSGIVDTAAFRDQLERDARADLVRGYVLFLKQRPIAYCYCYAVDDSLVCSKVGFDPEFAQLSPGTVLLHRVLEGLFEHDRFRRFDFGRGEFAYKEHYATAEMSCVDTFYFPLTVENLAFAAAHHGLKVVSRSASRWLAAIGVKDAAKRGLRDFAARRNAASRSRVLDERVR